MKAVYDLRELKGYDGYVKIKFPTEKNSDINGYS